MLQEIDTNFIEFKMIEFKYQVLIMISNCTNFTLLLLLYKSLKTYLLSHLAT